MPGQWSLKIKRDHKDPISLEIRMSLRLGGSCFHISIIFYVLSAVLFMESMFLVILPVCLWCCRPWLFMPLEEQASRKRWDCSHQDHVVRKCFNSCRSVGRMKYPRLQWGKQQFCWFSNLKISIAMLLTQRYLKILDHIAYDNLFSWPSVLTELFCNFSWNFVPPKMMLVTITGLNDTIEKIKQRCHEIHYRSYETSVIKLNFHATTKLCYFLIILFSNTGVCILVRQTWNYIDILLF